MHQLKRVYILRLDVLLSGVIRIENPNFECHRKYLVYALRNLRCVTVLYTSAKSREWTQVQHIKWSFKFEFELETKTCREFSDLNLNSNLEKY
jgi:hypothetical protein